MMPLFEVRFHRADTHPYFVQAEDDLEARGKATFAHNKGTQRSGHAGIDDIVVCIPTDKVRLESVCNPYIQTPRSGQNVGICYIERAIDSIREYGLFIEQPEFQRAHVWTEAQQIAFVEHLLRGGVSGREIFLNRPAGWDDANNCSWPTVVVDGLQRLTAVRKFVANELTVFGQYTFDSFQYLNNVDLIFVRNDLTEDADVLRWYLQMNSGGTPHTEEELTKVRMLLEEIDEE